MNRTWTAVLVFVIVVSLVLLCGLGLLALLFLPGRMGMMGGTFGSWRCPLCGTTMPFGSRSMAGVLVLGVAAVVAVGHVVLLVLGIAWLMRRAETAPPPKPPAATSEGDAPVTGSSRRRAKRS
jgi:hypothetical protein